MREKLMSRRGAFSLLGLAAALGVAVPTTMLSMSEAEAQTAGMERREGRRTGRATSGEAQRSPDAARGAVASSPSANPPCY